jgi:hypothetical protein
MKTAQLPPVRVEPAVREEIESVLQEGESLSQFVEAAAVQAARRRKAQQAFLARGRASMARAKETGEFHALHGALDQMRERLDRRVEEARRAPPPKPPKPRRP